MSLGGNLKAMVKKLIILLCLFQVYVSANEACSRIAIINQQEFLVDPNLNRKGEGLRFYLERDDKAKELLEKYQNTSSHRLRPAIIGSIGTLMLLGTVFINTSDNNKKALLIGGVSTLFVNFLVTKTIENNNEKHLIEAVHEYNKRRSPKIFFKSEDGEVVEPKVYLEKTWSF